MDWEYPYTFGQGQESLHDRLVTASLYGMRLVRTGYTDPWSHPAPPAAAEFPAAKQAAFLAYVMDADVSSTQEPQCSIATGSDGREAFTCPEEQCGAFDNMPCYFCHRRTVDCALEHFPCRGGTGHHLYCH